MKEKRNAIVVMKGARRVEQHLKSQITLQNILHAIWKGWCILCRLVDAAMTVGIILMVYLYLTQPETAIMILKSLPVWTERLEKVIKMLPLWIQVYLEPGILV